MLSPVLEKILILQDRDGRRIGLETQLQAVPKDVALVENKIAAEKTAIEEAKMELRQLETDKKLLETEIGSTEDKLGKYRTQQSAVKKNDEYQALGHQIETTEAEVSKMEEKELEIMYAIDESKKRFQAAEKVLQENIAGHEGKIVALGERKTNLESELATVQAEVAAAREPVEDRPLALYDRIAKLYMPVCVPLKGGKCGGCHLKVSSEVESTSRSKSLDNELATCDQCSRLVYWES